MPVHGAGIRSQAKIGLCIDNMPELEPELELELEPELEPELELEPTLEPQLDVIRFAGDLI